MLRSKKSLLINIAFILAAALVSYSASRMVRNVLITKTRSDEMTQKIEELKKKKQELEAALVELRTKEAVEREAKARLNLKKPGEEVVVVVPDEKKNNAPVTKSQTFWSRITSFFHFP